MYDTAYVNTGLWKRSRKVRASRVSVITFLLLVSRSSIADEGMWTFDNPPTTQLHQRYGFTPTRQWLDHVRLSSVRFNDGGSGSFISPHGLVLTNHHVALGQLQKLSTPQKDYVTDGFYARTPAEELKCPDLELNVLMSTENVTARVRTAFKPGLSDQQALSARKAVVAEIQRESLERTGLRSDVIPLYQDSEYWLYRYKKYTDVRLVFAPEQQAAYFGGDPDNFTYPRYDLDMAIFRAYENNRPVESTNYLKWNPKGAADGDLVFVSGNPGSTSRLETVSQLETTRDCSLPLLQRIYKERVEVLQKYSAEGSEQARQALNTIFSLQNTIKAREGEYEGLKDPEVMAKKRKEEADFRQRINTDPQWQREYATAWEDIARASQAYRTHYQWALRSVHFSRLAETAVTIVQYATEIKKPDGQRLEGYHDSELESLRFELFSTAPVYPELQKLELATALRQALELLGPDDDYVKAALNGQSPQQAADHAISGTKLADPVARKALIDGGEAAIAASDDSLIVFARRIDPVLRATRKWFEDNVESVESRAGQQIGAARFAAYGTSQYPDATFTLRLSYGTVKGYPMNGTQAPPKTTVYGLYDRADSFNQRPPFDLPQRYRDHKNELDMATPMNFVNTCDIIGGNSGSPVINRAGELVGLIFDGNIESLVGDYIYDGSRNRAVAVHTAVMTEAMRKLYGAGALVDEIQGRTEIGQATSGK
jgi:hypothetical protein